LKKTGWISSKVKQRAQGQKTRKSPSKRGNRSGRQVPGPGEAGVCGSFDHTRPDPLRSAGYGGHAWNARGVGGPG